MSNLTADFSARQADAIRRLQEMRQKSKGVISLQSAKDEQNNISFPPKSTNDTSIPSAAPVSLIQNAKTEQNTDPSLSEPQQENALPPLDQPIASASAQEKSESPEEKDNHVPFTTVPKEHPLSSEPASRHDTTKQTEKTRPLAPSAASKQSYAGNRGFLGLSIDKESVLLLLLLWFLYQEKADRNLLLALCYILFAP